MNKEPTVLMRWLRGGNGNENVSQNTRAGGANSSSSSGGAFPREKTSRRRQRKNVIESVLDRGVTGRLCSWSESMLHGTSMGMHSCVGHCGFRGEVVGLQTGSLHDAMLSGQRRVYPHDESIQCVEMDRIGELCATGDSYGLVMVNYVSSIHGAVSADGGMCDTALSLQTSTARRKISSLRWNPMNQDELAVVHQRATRVLVYDINRTTGQPSQTCLLPADVHGGHDMVYFNETSSQGQSYCSAVGCGDGSVLLWDSRKKGSPACSLRGLTRSGATVSLEIVDHGRLVLGGTSGRDQIHVWDLRKVSGSSLTFSAVPNKHPLLHSVSLSQELVRVPGLIDESGYIPPCMPQSLHADPYSYHRLACHMACGWTAVFDMTSMEMTHIHAPPSSAMGCVDQGLSLEDAAHARRVGDSGRVALPHEVVTHGPEAPERTAGNSRPMSGRQAGCWRNASEFVVPSRAKDALFIIDFSSSIHSGTRIKDQYSMDQMGQPKAAVDVEIPHAASCAVISEPSGSILAFGAQGRCSKVT
ncbi:hypothetical protein M9434_004577 [Picochlorum sp. BPE23]|nr:hypothetical protein M9434_004577 [Picochlorum sp. BPE23]